MQGKNKAGVAEREGRPPLVWWPVVEEISDMYLLITMERIRRIVAMISLRGRGCSHFPEVHLRLPSIQSIIAVSLLSARIPAKKH